MSADWHGTIKLIEAMHALIRFRIIFVLMVLSSAMNSCHSSGVKTEEQQRAPENILRYGQVIGVKPDKLDRYRELHANPWTCVLEKLKECNIRNYSIYLQDSLLFAYFEYVGEDFTADMEKMAADSCTQRWWGETGPCQVLLNSRKEGEYWTTMEEIFHME